MRLRPASLRYRVGTDIPDVSIDSNRLAPPLDDVTISDEQLETWWDIRSDLHGAAPRDARNPVWDGIYHRLLGYVDTPNGDTGRCWRRTADPAHAWRHLLTIGYDYTVGFEVADGGKLQIAIAPRDLRQGRFNRVCGIFDSA